MVSALSPTLSDLGRVVCFGRDGAVLEQGFLGRCVEKVDMRVAERYGSPAATNSRALHDEPCTDVNLVDARAQQPAPQIEPTTLPEPVSTAWLALDERRPSIQSDRSLSYVTPPYLPSHYTADVRRAVVLLI